MKCPRCGKGKVLAGYLKQAEACTNCGERTGDIAADDGPAWATILLVGHLVSPLFVLFASRDPSIWAFVFVAGLMVVMTLALLPRMKGMFIGLIWANRAGELQPEQSLD